MARLLDNWLTSYSEWTLPRSESPESMIMWAGLFAVASATKRHVYFPKSMMGSYTIYPHLYIIFVAKPGVARKSTTAGFTETLLQADLMQDINIASTAMSASKLIEVLSETNDGSLTILSSELGTFMNVSKDEMYDVLTDLFDGKIKYEYATRAHGLEITDNPCINFLAATTPSWMSEQMPAYVIGGGFASRCVFVYEDRVRRRQLYYDLDWRTYEDLGTALAHDLAHIGGLEGKFSHDCRETQDAMEGWYQKTADEEDVDTSVEGYFQRKPVLVHKVAMILSMCERDDLRISMTHFEAAKAILEGVEAQMPRAFSAVGRNPYSSLIVEVLDFITAAQGEPVSRRMIAQRFYRQLQGPELDEVLGTLTTMEEIEYVGTIDGKKVRAYKAT